MSRNNKHKSNKTWIIIIAIALALVIWKLASKMASPTEAGRVEVAESREAAKSESPVSEPWLKQMVAMPDSVASQIVEYPGYTASFNPERHVPNWVCWELTADEAKAREASRDGLTFIADPDVDGSPTPADYQRSGYTKGHMCPAGDMKWNQDAMNSTFNFTNICPQTRALNAGIWNTLESQCRNWARRDSAIIIICGPVLTDMSTRTIGNSQVAVPERFFKVILAPSQGRGIGFVMPNDYVSGGLNSTAVSIDEIESITGFDFFPLIPQDVQDEIESQCNYPLWTQKRRHH